jgi:hypothetical protein
VLTWLHERHRDDGNGGGFRAPNRLAIDGNDAITGHERALGRHVIDYGMPNAKMASRRNAPAQSRYENAHDGDSEHRTPTL